MGFVGQHDEPHSPAVAADRLIHTLGLNGESAAVVVRFARSSRLRRRAPDSAG